MKKILILVLLMGGAAFLSMESCNKSNYTDAYVIEDGDGVTTGCGWLININGEVFIPVGLRNEDLVNGKVITIQYAVSEFPSQCAGGESYPVATITKFLK